MPSLVPGFEYDIFVSYRHKDNKHDGWVTEFVRTLRSELEATFKEDISIYFDENPHDGFQTFPFTGGGRDGYDVTGDGQRFLVSSYQDSEGISSPVTLMVNWVGEIKK